jgi:peptidyl-dipeptidase Dcp
MQRPNPASDPGTNNPLLSEWATAFGVPPFASITPEHFRPAFDRALDVHMGEIDAIAADRTEPTFDNTIAALERSGKPLARVAAVFYALAGAHTNDALLAIEREIAPRLAAHWDRIYMNGALYRRIEALHGRRDSLGLTGEQARVLTRYRIMFRRAGAGLDRTARARLAEIGERLAALGTTFSQNVLADEQSYALVLDGDDDLAGLPDHLRAAARDAAEERGILGKHAVTLSRSSAESFLQSSHRRDLREKLFRAFIARGEGGGATDNMAIIAEMVQLRAERAKLLGYRSFAQYRLDDAMAKTPEAARDLLQQVWEPARERALADRDAMQALVHAEGGNFALEAWDWRYYAEKLRKQRCDLDDAEIEPYLQLDNMIAAAFETARRLFGLTVTPLPDVPTWHPDVRVWDVRADDGRHLGLFFGDYFARPTKRSGAWMTTLREQERLSDDIRPLVLNVMNFSKARDGEPTLISFEDARTLFHEFGHALHALLSDVTYPIIAGTAVATDFVELPSQLYEHWLETPDILRSFARHHRTGEPMPEDLVRRLVATRTFNQAFKAVEFIASAIVDLDFHSLPEARDVEPAAFEAATLARIGMPAEIAMRHRSPHFTHVFVSDHYASGYYSYMWSEVLDTDAFKAFEETGDVFDPATATRLREHVYSAGGSREPDDAYKAFRGRLPTPDALLSRRGFTSRRAGMIG